MYVSITGNYIDLLGEGYIFLGPCHCYWGARHCVEWPTKMHKVVYVLVIVWHASVIGRHTLVIG